MREQGLPLPPQRDLSDLRADASLAEIWSATVLVIAEPLPSDGADAVAA